ncbi:carbohydrate kinase [Rhizobium sp. Root274]|uniref:PfkB family carbohydrate kinase n=1 Tax=unclassified Rhizobium TaxID=2613769 RepID=UPI000715E1A6|nr:MULTISPECIES: PfkB family carbohydrate kinase [unclassified Rhizobium]KQW29519.1 carbohydrate kinase [Rhizobium sp. Root1240]KRD29711.1 carbohydrate kinase [Rhizobium sp. Root274]
MTDVTDGRIVVIGHVNHDCIWRLTEPLRAGGRILWSSRETRLGGGGYFTARRLRDLGHPVAILSNLMTDEHGDRAMADLDALGFDTSLMTRLPGETDFADILLDPMGERTILSNERRLSREFVLAMPLSDGAFYVNAPILPDTILAALHQARLVVSQLPLRQAVPRPADIMIGSKADLPAKSITDCWSLANALADGRLRHLVMTDGPQAISIYDGTREITVAIEQQVVAVRDTIGAGDSFSGGLIHALLSGADIVEAARMAAVLTAEWLASREQQTLAMTTEKTAL